MKVYFFLGKGGVGKTTISAAFGTGLSKNGHKVIVVSIDPAHNLGDAFDTTLSNRELKINENLYAVEIDIEKMTREYLDELSKKMQHTYRYLTAMNLDRYFNILRRKALHILLEQCKVVALNRDFKLKLGLKPGDV